MGKAWVYEQGRVNSAAMHTCFPFLLERGHVISLVGGGGKTTLMHELAACYAQSGMKTVVMTTTRMQRPSRIDQTIEECQKRWAAGEYAVCGEITQEGKMREPKEGLVSEILACADEVLIEADGAKRMACKAPAVHEPVILPQSDIVIGVMGLDVLGGRVEEVCFRPELVIKALGCREEHRLTPEDLARLLLSPLGTRKAVGERAYYTVLNKCDDALRLEGGRQVLEALAGYGHTRAVLTKLKADV